MNVIKNRHIFLTVSGILVVASIMSLALFGLRLGIDFVGGTLWQFNITTEEQSAPVTTEALRMLFAEDESIESARVSEIEPNRFIARLNNISNETHQRLAQTITAQYGEVEDERFESIGPSIGAELRTKAIWAIILVLGGISLYVAFAFRKTSVVIPSWKYGMIALGTLFHDVIIPIGFFALLGKLYAVEIDINFVVAMLVIMGFSIHDTIVIFDRIRENLLVARHHGKTNKPLNEIINIAVQSSFARSINTSLTLVFVLVTLLAFGPSALMYFILTILVGTIVGTYSSLFVASPLLYMVTKKG